MGEDGVIRVQELGLFSENWQGFFSGSLDYGERDCLIEIIKDIF